MKQRQQYRQLYCVLHCFHNPHLHLPKPVGGTGNGGKSSTKSRERRRREGSGGEVGWEVVRWLYFLLSQLGHLRGFIPGIVLNWINPKLISGYLS